jgi:general secretion pathway protein I
MNRKIEKSHHFEGKMGEKNGFTLLEVLLAMTIVGMVLGTIFGLLAGSKRLAFQAAEDIEQVIFFRSAINATQVLKEPAYPELPERYRNRVELKVEEPVEKPERQTRPMRLGLEPYILLDDETGVELRSVRLILRDVAE